jgi:hypothetical protein
MTVRRVVAGVLAVGLVLGPVAHDVRAQSQGAPAADSSAQARPTPPPSPDPSRGVDVDQLPVSVDRIGRRLARPATISLQLAQPMFRTEVVETAPKWLGDIEWIPEEDRRLPVPPGPAWHREFLSMVTPPQARAFGQVRGMDLLQFLGLSFAEGVAANMVAGKIKELKKGAERRRAAEAQAEVDAAIEAWKRGREKAASGSPAPVVTPPQ